MNTNTSPTRVARVAVRTLLVAMIAALAPQPVAGQEDDAFFPVFVLACDAYVQMQGSASGAGYPPECRGVEAMKVTAFDTEGAYLAECTTDANGNCRLAIGYNGVHIFTQDPAAIPEGYRADSNVQRLFTYTEFAEVAFHNYLEEVRPQRDGGTAAVRVQSRICPESYSGDDFFNDCNGGIPATDQWIFANGAYNRTGTDGNATLRYVPTGEVRLVGAQSFTTGDVYFSCYMTREPSVVVESSVEVLGVLDGITRDFTGIFTIEPNTDVTCLWYQIPLLDRGLWNTVLNQVAPADSTATYVDGFGAINLYVSGCPAGTVPADLAEASSACTEGVANATVRITTDDGNELTSGTTNGDGNVELTLSGLTVPSFSLTLDERADNASDTIACFANRLGDGDATDPIYQSVVRNGPGWTIPGFGDDAQGVICFWYLVQA